MREGTLSEGVTTKVCPTGNVARVLAEIRSKKVQRSSPLGQSRGSASGSGTVFFAVAGGRRLMHCRGHRETVLPSRTSDKHQQKNRCIPQCNTP